MNEEEQWIHLDGPEPESMRELFETLRAVEPPTPEDSARLERALFARLAATRGGQPVRTVAAAPEPEARPAVAPPEPEARPAVAPPEPEARPAVAPPEPEARPAVAPPAEASPEVVPARRSNPRFVVQPPDEMDEPIYGRSEAHAPTHAGSPPEVLFASSTGGLDLGTPPDLDRQQYASLCAELAVNPHRSAEILPRYGVHSPAEQRALDDHWIQHLRAHPEEVVAFKADFKRFFTHVWSLRGRQSRPSAGASDARLETSPPPRCTAAGEPAPSLPEK
jgi:hypothetical protein